YVFPFYYESHMPTPPLPLSLHDALPISLAKSSPAFAFFLPATLAGCTFRVFGNLHIDKAAVHLEFVEGLKYKIGKLGIRIEKGRSEEHTSELQSREKLVCRLLLEKKKKE